jgi:VIT1/CCC1 family predicted Fe2+/Mn2+ transporter
MGTSRRLNWLRAGVLGANDGIVSTAGLVVGVAGATAARAPIMTAGIAGLVAGAVSMALGEYVSVSSQRDSERSLLATERAELETSPEAELEELAAIYVAKGATVETARRLAEELTAHDAFAAHADAELGIDPAASPTHGTRPPRPPSPSPWDRRCPSWPSCCRRPNSGFQSHSWQCFSPWPSPARSARALAELGSGRRCSGSCWAEPPQWR